MRWSKLAAGLLSVAAVADAKRSFQHVGKRDPTPKSTIDEHTLEHFLATRKVAAPKFLNNNTTSKKLVPTTH